MKLSGLLLIFVGAVASHGLAQDAASVRTKIIALEKAWNQAYKMGDSHALGDILDDDIVLTNDDGSAQSKREFLASIRPSNGQEQQVSPESISVHVFGDTAVATGVFVAKGVEGGKTYTRRERFVDTWISRNGKWVCIATDATPIVH